MDRWVAQEEEPRSDIVKLLLYELNTAISPREKRIAALRACLDEFNHDDPSKHDEELDQQADMILFQKLAYIFAIRKGDHEVGLLACALEMAHRASRRRVALSFTEIGSVTLPLFVEMIRCDSSPMTNNGHHSSSSSTKQQSPSSDHEHHHELAGVSSSLTARDQSRSDGTAGNMDVVLPDITENNIALNSEHDSASMLLAHEKDKGESSTQASSVDSESQVSNMSSPTNNTKNVRFADSIEDVQLEQRKTSSTNKLAVRKILRVLRYYSRVLSAMKPMAHHPGLLDALIFQLQHGQYKKPLASQMAINVDLVDDNTRNSQKYGTSNGDIADDSSARTTRVTNQDSLRGNQRLDAISSARIDVIATIVNLACADENKSKLLYHPGLLEAVIDIAEDDCIDEAQEHAAIVLMNLAIADNNKMFMACHDNLLHVLVKLMSGAKSPHTRRYASTTIFSLASAPANTQRVGEFADGHILSALVHVLENDKAEEVRVNAAETLFNMARNFCLARGDDDNENKENGEDDDHILGTHPDILPTLARTVTSDYSADVRAYCARTLEWLAADIHEPSPYHGRLLDALAKASSWTKTSCLAEAFKTQTDISANRKAMVEHDEILDSLANLASLDGINDDEVRNCALISIERLTEEESTRGIMASHEGIMTALTRASFHSPGVLEGFNDEDLGANKVTKAALKNLADAL